MKNYSNINVHTVRSTATWLWLPAIVMSLGWGLRGYIGGGPFGAMIPGGLVALILCQLLGTSLATAAVVVAFGTFGIAFGGNMTYGQTLGLIRGQETFWWGLLGTTLKGSVWGMLGGGVLGVGFATRFMARRHAFAVFAFMLIGIFIGLYWINQPKLIYFSDPVVKPRDESWAGFLLGALALLAAMQIWQRQLAWIPMRLAAYGAIGGGLGFGVGSLFLALQGSVPESWQWLPYWKFMEFTFGFSFGAALGLGTQSLSQRLAQLERPDLVRVDSSLDTLQDAGPWLMQLLLAVLTVVSVFLVWQPMVRQLLPLLRELPSDDGRRTAFDVLAGFGGLGCLLMLLARCSKTVAWHGALSVAIVAAAIDWQADLLTHGHIAVGPSLRFMFVLAVAAVSILAICRWQRQNQPALMDLYMFALCAFMGIGYLKGLGVADIWLGNSEAQASAGSYSKYLWQTYRGEILVHLIFTLLFVLSMWAGLRERGRAASTAAID